MSVYRALARKYRSRHFGELIGQDVLVRTLTNAIENDRLHHAYMFTGIRGTGKTSTARILAKAINYVGADGKGKPTVGPTDDCDICRAIGEDRHPDVIEIDAASNTGVDDVRQIIDNVRYAPVQARYKVFIIDEVHMLSKNAFNALLKTLEEPPPHIIFMLATTEIRKVPTTILSRCQRFDLRRIEIETLVTHYRRIAGLENVTVADKALYLIANAADGSVRDGLSIFDQAIAQSGGAAITAKTVEDMLGYANSEAVAGIFAQLMRGQIKDVLQKLAQLYVSGTDPAALLDDLLEATHLVTRVKIMPDLATDQTIISGLRTQAEALSNEFSLSSLTRVWQMLLKAVPEVAHAPHPQQALEMALIRIGYAAPLPPLDELLKRIDAGGAGVSMPAPSPAPPVEAPPTEAPVTRPRLTTISNHAVAAIAVPTPQPEPVSATTPEPVSEFVGNVAPLPDFAALVKMAERNGDMMLAGDLFTNVRVLKFAPGQLEISILPGAAKDLVQQLQKKISEWTGAFWPIAIASQMPGTGWPLTLMEQSKIDKRAAIEKAYHDPAILAIKGIIPAITITDLTMENDQ